MLKFISILVAVSFVLIFNAFGSLQHPDKLIISGNIILDPDTISLGLNAKKVEITGGKAPHRTFDHLSEALQAGGYSQGKASRFESIVSEALKKRNKSLIAGEIENDKNDRQYNRDRDQDIGSEMEEVTIKLEQILPGTQRLPFTIYIDPQGEKNCDQISNRCVKCPGGKIKCYVPKP